MRHLAIVLCAVASPAVAAPAFVARIGVLALENGSTTRAPVATIVLGGRYPLADNLGAALSYRGALRDAGTDVAGVFTTVQRLVAGGYATTQLGVIRLGLEAGASPWLTTAYLHGPGKDFTATDFGIAASLDGELALRLGESSWATFVLGATHRGPRFDFSATVGVEL